jgi:hypothetical protein
MPAHDPFHPPNPCSLRSGVCLLADILRARKVGRNAMSTLTQAQREALEWFSHHNGDGAFANRGGTLLAGGEIAPHTRSTFNALISGGYIEKYDRKRIRLTAAGKAENRLK